MLQRVFLERGARKAEELIGKGVRHGLSTVGGLLLGADMVTAEQAATIDSLYGGLMILAAAGLSVARTWVSKRL